MYAQDHESGQLTNPGEYNDVTIEYSNKKIDFYAIDLVGSDSGTDPSKITINGDINIDVESHQSQGISLTDGKTGGAILTANGNTNVKVKGDYMAYGIVSGVKYGHTISPDGSTNKGKIELLGKENTINVYGGARAYGLIAGSAMGNSSGPEIAGDIYLGSVGSINTINVSGGDKSPIANGEYEYKFAGILAYADGIESNRAKVTVKGNTSINLDVSGWDWTDSDQLFNKTRVGVYAAKRSDILFSNADSLDILLNGNYHQYYQVGLFAGAYDAQNKITGDNSSKITVNTTNTTITSSNAGRFYGVASYGGSTIDLNTNLNLVVNDDDYCYEWVLGLEAGRQFDNMLAVDKKGGNINLTGSYSIKMPDWAVLSDMHWVAINVDSSGTEPGYTSQISVNGENATSKIHGLITAIHGGIANLNIDGKDSFIKGHIDERYKKDNGSWGNIDNNGTINLTLSNGATWYNLDYGSTDVIDRDTGKVTLNFGDGISALNSLTMNNGNLDMSSMPIDQNGSTWQRSAFQKVWMKNLSGTGNFIMDMDLANEIDDQADKDYYKEKTDQIKIDEKAEGTYKTTINFVNSGDIDPNKFYSQNWIISQADGTMTVNGNNGDDSSFTGDGMVSMWAIRFVKDGEDKLDNNDYRAGLTNKGEGKGNWYLVRTDDLTPEPKPDPEKPNPEQPDPENPAKPDPKPNPNPQLPPEIETNINIGTSASQALAYFSDLDDLRWRLGEVRYGAQSGIWAKAFTKQDRVSGSNRHGFKQDYSGINVGYDRFATVNEDYGWLVGGALRYGHADQEGFASTGSGTGDLDEYSAKLYATYMHKGGSYADFVLQAGHYEQDLSGLSNTGRSKSTASYDTFGAGASIEVGHMFTFNNGEDDRPWFNHWFVEPQAQLAYFYADGANYTTSTGLKVKQGDADFLTGRLGVVIGKKFNYGDNNELDKRYFQVALIGGIKHEFLGDQDIKYTGIDGISKTLFADDIDGTRFYYGVNADFEVSQNVRLYAQIDREEGDHYTQDYDISFGIKAAF